jgi:cell division protein FtsQ
LRHFLSGIVRVDGGGRIMPKVTKKKAPARRKATRREPGFIERMGALFEQYTLASFAGAAVLIAAGVIVLWAGGYLGMLSQSVSRFTGNVAVKSGLEIRTVSLRGAHQTSNDEVLDALGPVLGESIVHFSPDAARARVEQIGWVRAASVTRLLPDTVHISVREREPAAVWQINNDLLLIDDNGAVIRDVSAYEYSNLPFIVGAGAPEAASGILRTLSNHDDLQYMTYALVRVGERRWNMRLRNGIDIKLPEAGYESAIDDLALLHAAHGTLDQPIEYIDFRDPERMVIRKRGETGPGAQPAKAG